ncbi:hypothetical protein E2C01_021334 [Portunus trituberculatus]|uniref:Uncharacterized protein n=1 Tax=Portunus trituberculatus TaxID=210409 RepID=A0A5B7E3Z0_PORTR|nr:hypothetical protein [Portunus trituberculatus]
MAQSKAEMWPKTKAWSLKENACAQNGQEVRSNPTQPLLHPTHTPHRTHYHAQGREPMERCSKTHEMNLRRRKRQEKKKNKPVDLARCLVPLAPESFPSVLNGEYLLLRGCILRGLDESERLALEERHGAGVRSWRGKMEEKRRRVVFSSNLHERPSPSGRLLFNPFFIGTYRPNSP